MITNIARSARAGLLGGHYNLGVALEQNGDLQAALDEFRRGGEIQPSDPDYRAAYERVSKKLKP